LDYVYCVEDGVPTLEKGVDITITQQKELLVMKLKDLKTKNYSFQIIYNLS